MFGISIQPYALPVLAKVGWWEMTVNGSVVASWRRWEGDEMRAYWGRGRSL